MLQSRSLCLSHISLSTCGHILSSEAPSHLVDLVDLWRISPFIVQLLLPRLPGPAAACIETTVSISEGLTLLLPDWHTVAVPVNKTLFTVIC